MKVVLLKRCRFSRRVVCPTPKMPLPDDDDDVVTRPNFALVINAFVLSPMSSSSSSSSIRSTTTTSTVYVLLRHIREREREKQSSSLFFISFYCKVIVIFAYVPQKSQMSFCANELRAFFFLAQKSTNTLNNTTRQTGAVFFATTVQIFFLSAAYSNPHTYS